MATMQEKADETYRQMNEADRRNATAWANTAYDKAISDCFDRCHRLTSDTAFMAAVAEDFGDYLETMSTILSFAPRLHKKEDL